MNNIQKELKYCLRFALIVLPIFFLGALGCYYKNQKCAKQKTVPQQPQPSKTTIVPQQEPKQNPTKGKETTSKEGEQHRSLIQELLDDDKENLGAEKESLLASSGSREEGEGENDAQEAGDTPDDWDRPPAQ